MMASALIKFDPLLIIIRIYFVIANIHVTEIFTVAFSLKSIQFVISVLCTDHAYDFSC